MIEGLHFLIKHGGITAYIIIILFVLLMLIGFERIYILYFKLSYDMKPFLEKIQALVKKRDYPGAIQLCNTTHQTPETIVLKAALMASENGREAMKSAIGAAVLNVTSLTGARMSVIALIAALSTLLGLLGTISGLIGTFAALAQADASLKAQMLGTGISEAMYATASGLILGMIAMTFHSLGTSKGETHISNAQDAGFKIVGWIEESERGKDG
jgi:biopolymer transport protein ExbB/TolQ